MLRQTSLTSSGGLDTYPHVATSGCCAGVWADAWSMHRRWRVRRWRRSQVARAPWARASLQAFFSCRQGYLAGGSSCSSRQGGDGLPRPCQSSRQGWLAGAQSFFLGGRVSPWQCLSPRQGALAGVSSSFPASECLPGACNMYLVASESCFRPKL